MDTINVFVIEDDESDLKQILDYCSEVKKELDIPIEPITMRSTKEFEEQIKIREPHIMIVDLKLGESAEDRSGWESIRKVIDREIIPVIVYSAFAAVEPEEALNTAFIKRIVKGEGEKFIDILKRRIKMKSALNEEKNRIKQEFSKLTLQTICKILDDVESDEIDENILVSLATGRLISYLMHFPPGGEEKFLPESIFVYPPLEIFSSNCLLLGEFLEQKINESGKILWLVVSPSCDLVFLTGRKPKVNKVLLLRCYRNYREMPWIKNDESENKRKNVLKNKIINGKNGKILKSPKKIFGSEYIVIDFKEYLSESYERIIDGLQNDTWKKLASISIPYAESLKNLFISDLSRIGTPDTALNDDELKWIGEFVK